MSGQVRLRDAEARERIAHDLDVSMMVEAAAGTGKTTVLVRRIVEILRSGRADPSSIVAITFTRRAAGELKLRLRRELDRALSESPDEPVRTRLWTAASTLEEAHIGTIHSFCGDLLRERPVEARVDPGFDEFGEEEAGAFFDQVFRRWVEDRLGDLPDGFSRVLNRSMARQQGASDSPTRQLRDAAWKFRDWRDFGASWEQRPFDRKGEIDQLVDRIQAMVETTGRPANRRDPLWESLRPLYELEAWISRAERERGRDHDQLEAFLVNLPRQIKKVRYLGSGPFAGGVPRKAVLDSRERLLGELEDFVQAADADLAVYLQQEFRFLIDQYERAKERSGNLDFVDLLIRARNLVRDAPGVRAHFQTRFSHILVDEFQDTDPLQAELLFLLACEDPAVCDWRRARPAPGKFFLVGDPKQSIYRFRRADVLLYEEIKSRLVKWGTPLLHLTENFRSAEPVLSLVNAAFADEMALDLDAGQPGYVPLTATRTALPSQPSILALPVPAPYGKMYLSRAAVEASLPAAIAGFVAWAIEKSGWVVRDPSSGGRETPVRPGHFAILFRRFVSWGNDMTRDYARELEARGVPHILLGSRSFHGREEVEMIRTALTAIERPDDELEVYASLRGSLFSIPDRVLLWYRHQFGKLNPLSRVEGEAPPALEPVSRALEILAHLHGERNRRSIVSTINELLESTRAQAGFALRPAGHQVLANVRRICNMARWYELRGGTSFRGFVEWLHEQAERRTPEAPVFEEGMDGVQLTTVHAAKGLEYPIVILADMTCRQSIARADRYIDLDRDLAAFSLMGCRPWELLENEELETTRDRAEAVRIAYVAATRARDMLVVPAVGDEAMDGWLGVLNPGIYPPVERRRKPLPAPGCPPFGSDSVVDRPPAAFQSLGTSVAPGLHQAEQGTQPVVWFDPHLLNLSVSGNLGLRQEQLLAEAPPGGSVDDGLAEFRNWNRLRDRRLESGALPSRTLLNVHESLSRRDPPELIPVHFAAPEERPQRPGGRTFGVLVHAVLRDVPLDAEENEIGRLVNLQGRLLRSTREECAAAVRAVVEVLQHPLMERARRSGSCHREFPVVLPLEGGELLEGSIDLAFQEGADWVVVDFKSDVTAAGLPPNYVRQVQWYAFALRRTLAENVEGWILAV